MGATTTAATAAAATTAAARLGQHLRYHWSRVEVEGLERDVQQKRQEAVVHHHFGWRARVRIEIEYPLGHDRQDYAPPEAPQRQHDHGVQPVAEHLLEQVLADA
jgi:hypothetical protein